MNTRLLFALVFISFMGACQGEIAVSADTPLPLQTSPTPTPPAPVKAPAEEPIPATPTPTENAALPQLTGDQAVFYMRSIVQMLAGRPLQTQEVEGLQTQGSAAIPGILEAWTREVGFVENTRFMMAQKLKASGEREGIDFDAPGRLVAHIVQNDLPFSQVVTSDYCIAQDGSQTTCDSGAPYSAGVLTTRAFLAGNAGRFNLGRASRLMKVFSCRAYPMEDTLQPYLPRDVLIPMFRASTAEEQTVEEAKGAFGNGDGCYTCHGQFSAHSQFFVKFDQTGLWRAEATGLQDPEGELGRSISGLMTSHMDDPAAAAFEGSKMFGQDVNDLRGAALVMTQNDAFVQCMVRNAIEHTFGMTDTAADAIDRQLLAAISERVTQSGTHDPTWAQIVQTTFADPRVIQVVLGTQGEVQ